LRHAPNEVETTMRRLVCSAFETSAIRPYRPRAPHLPPSSPPDALRRGVTTRPAYRFRCDRGYVQDLRHRDHSDPPILLGEHHVNEKENLVARTSTG
jgi:hypothetical protein